ncbi:MAG: hypothetical protein ACREIF_09545 [Chthoniobacterales bacterium]
MKLPLLIAVGLVTALSVGAQTTNDEKQQATPAKKGKPKTEQKAKANPERDVHQPAQLSERKRSNAQGPEQAREVRTSTTVYRNGHKTTEHLNLHRNVRESSDVHFSIGSHPRAWWLSSYPIVLMGGCYYYLADNGCWYPAYGFEPGCVFPVGVVYCE